MVDWRRNTLYGVHMEISVKGASSRTTMNLKTY